MLNVRKVKDLLFEKMLVNIERATTTYIKNSDKREPFGFRFLLSFNNLKSALLLIRYFSYTGPLANIENFTNRKHEENFDRSAIPIKHQYWPHANG